MSDKKPRVMERAEPDKASTPAQGAVRQIVRVFAGLAATYLTAHGIPIPEAVVTELSIAVGGFVVVGLSALGKWLRNKGSAIGDWI